MSDTLNPTPTPTEPTGENNAIREMRARIDAQNAELKAEKEARTAAEAKVQEAERAKLDELDRLKLELTDRDKRIGELTPLQERLQSFEAKAQEQYEAELATIPEDKRELVRTLSAKGTALDSLEALKSAKALIPGVPSTVGRPAPTDPGVTGPTFTPNPKDPWAGAFGPK